MQRSLPIVVPAVTAALGCYANSLGGALLFDDVNAIVDNPAVRTLDLHAIFATPSWWGSWTPIYRPVTTLTFALDHAVHGLDPFGYHLVNVLLHAAVCALLGLTLLRLTGAALVAALAALLFATHPVHTEAVAGVVGRAEELAARLGLAAWYVVLASSREGASRPSVAGTAGAAGLLVAAVLSKESALAFVAVIVAADLIYARDGDWRSRVAAWPVWAALGAAAAAAFVLRTVVVRGLGPPVGRLDNVLASAPVAARLLTAIGVLARYAHRLVWPFRLSADYSYPQIELASSSADPRFVEGLCLLIAAAGLAVWGLRRCRHACFAVVLSALTLAPVSNLVLPIGTVMAERLLYVPSIGFCLLVAAGVVAAARGTVARPRTASVLAAVFCLLIVAPYAAGTVSRNRVWRDRLTFFRTMVEDAPSSARSHRELGLVYGDIGRHDLAVAEIRRSLELEPGDPVTLYDLGNVELRAGRYDEAIAAYIAALERQPAAVDTVTNLGNAYSARGDEASAERWFRRGLTLAPNSAALHLNLANALLRQGRAGEAEASYRSALRFAPRDPLAHFNYGACLDALGRFDEAADAYRSALALAPDSPAAMARLVASLAYGGRRAEALAAQARAEARFPTDPAVLEARRLLGRVF